MLLLERGFCFVQSAVARLFDTDLWAASILIGLAEDRREQGIGALENRVHAKA